MGPGPFYPPSGLEKLDLAGLCFLLAGLVLASILVGTWHRFRH